MGADLGEFLRARRARVLPTDVGLDDGFRRRRVPGLRREEVAELAGVSVDYYMRLEQGRTPNPSVSVLDAVARALHLDHDERHHLYDLARRPAVLKEDDPKADGDIDEVMHRLLTSLADQPALVLTPAMTVAAANAAADVLFGPLAAVGGNMLRYAFTDATARARTPNWEDVAVEAVASLHVQAARYPFDEDLHDLVEELSAGSADFARLWARHDARERGTTTVNVVHPDVGVVSLTNLWLSPPASPRRTLVVYTVKPGSPSATRLDRLLGKKGRPEDGAPGRP
ncbi:helix-turn-helix transcriptional regulator [Streptomyces sp. NPDC005374]|uniref:helix-turn-helix transcriptional regulator n=1 Tax=Streptomyces sp. NPDC005374 TaxID=3364713 RepID=UPI0036C94F98